MHSTGMLRHQTIARLTSQHADTVVDKCIVLWDLVAAQIILLVGETGFESLYARSIFLSQSQFPWLAIDTPIGPADHRFAKLKASLQAQPGATAGEANRVLLVIFTDILASLIGEPLTASLLDSAWGSDIQIKADKEQASES